MYGLSLARRILSSARSGDLKHYVVLQVTQNGVADH